MKPYQFILMFFVCFALKAGAVIKDTIYKRGDFLIEVSDKTHIDIVRQGAHLKHKTSKGDTLFEAERYVVLGDDTNITVMGLYKKFHLKYKFSAFSTPIYSGKLAKPNFSTNRDAYGFRTQIRVQCQQAGINFAGHYTIVMWGCGTECQEMAIVDRINGKIYYSDEHPIINILAERLKCRPDSRLIVTNIGLLGTGRYKGYVSCFHDIHVESLEWINNKARRLPE